MTITNGYCSLVELKTQLGIELTDTDDDDELEPVVEAVSRWIDDKLGRRFYAASETRYFTATNTDYVIIDDLLSLTTLKTDTSGDGTYNQTWTNSDYRLHPRNASTDGEPYRMIRRAPQGSYYFPDVLDGVEVAGSFGYASSTPSAIKQACLIASERVWKRKDLIFGTAGNADLGTIEAIIPLSNDGEIMALLSSISRKWQSVRPR